MKATRGTTPTEKQRAKITINDLIALRELLKKNELESFKCEGMDLSKKQNSINDYEYVVKFEYKPSIATLIHLMGGW